MFFYSNFKNSELFRNRVHNLIPGGAHTYSKGDDQFPEIAPAAIKYGKGAYVWDLDENKYLDCSMGLSSVILGHAYEPVLDYVIKELYKGVNFQRPSEIELKMAEEFLSLVKCHDMIKFAQNGSTVNTAAVKLARAYTGRKMVAFPADHPFYSYDDWFISKTPCNKGIPDEITALSVTFKSGDVNSLINLFSEFPNKIACVITEPEKWEKLPENYLHEIIDITHKNGAIFILDEIITGFKTDFPGSLNKYNIKPDIATWGKSIANGFSFSAMTGTKEIMKMGGIIDEWQERVFLTSTTHGAETHAIAACLATIKEFKEKNVLHENHKTGKYFIRIVNEVISLNELEDYIRIIGDKWLPVFDISEPYGSNDLSFKTLLMQEMIKRGVLFQGIFVPSFSHTKNDVDFFAEALNDSLKVFKSALEKGVNKFLVGKPIRPVFRRYN